MDIFSEDTKPMLGYDILILRTVWDLCSGTDGAMLKPSLSLIPPWTIIYPLSDTPFRYIPHNMQTLITGKERAV